MDNRDSLDRSSTEFAQAKTPVNAPGSNGGSSLPIGGESPQRQQFPASVNDPSSAVESILQSDVCALSRSRLIVAANELDQIGINTLLNRLKQSIASARVRPSVSVSPVAWRS